MKVFLTGRPGIGKTTIVKRFVEDHRDEVLGFWTEEVRDPKTGKRVGFKILTTRGDSAVFARKDMDSDFRVGSYGVDLDVLENLALGYIESSLGDPQSIIVVDEVGKMELLSQRFQKLIETLVFEKEINLLGTIPEINFHPLIKRIKLSGKTRIISVNERNRDSVFETLKSLFDK